MRRRLVAHALAFALLGACGGGGGSSSSPTLQAALPQTYRASGHAAAGDVFVHLFEWRWADIARECEVWLGPKGFKAVQISPPSEHAVIPSAASGAPYPWWQRYQTVSYKLDNSRSGTAAEFDDMVARCRAVHVDIYADAVVNHMTALGSGTGSAGDAFDKYNYPAVPYGSAEFHPACSVTNYNDAFNVQQCELVGLADLKTETDGVRAKIAAYLVDLMKNHGVAGFRIDAAKHMHPRDIDAILSLVNNAATTAGLARPYAFLEVIDNPGEAVQASDFYGVGYASGGASDITEFQYGYRVSDAFLGRNGATLASLQNLSAALMPADKAVVFTDNHDNQRSNNIFYQDAAYELAVVYTLAQPVGNVSLMSSYGFDRRSAAGTDSGPPGVSNVTQSTFDPVTGASLCTKTLGSVQAGNWVCEHRRTAIANMVAFRHATAGAPLSNWQQLGSANQIAFARTGAGFVAFNIDQTNGTTATVQTTLPAGTYCNIAQGDFTPAGTSAAACTGPTVSVDATGQAAITVLPMNAIALHSGAKLN